jgi:hypothetical protein
MNENDRLLPHIIAEASPRVDLFGMAVKDPNILCHIAMDRSIKAKESLNTLGETKGIIHVAGGKFPAYFLGPSTGKEDILMTARQNGDYLKMNRLEIWVTVYEKPFFSIKKGPEETVEETLPQRAEQMMVTFAHEWELHVAPMIELFKWTKVQQEIMGKGPKNQELEDKEIKPMLDLLTGGEAAEHKDSTNLAYFLATLHQAKKWFSARNLNKEAAIIAAQEHMEMANLTISPQERDTLIAAILRKK